MAIASICAVRGFAIPQKVTAGAVDDAASAEWNEEYYVSFGHPL
jgi:hypothetical protein